MNLRKLFNLFSAAQKALLEEDKKNVLSKCNVIANKEWADQKENQESHDNVCPNCRTGKQDIVNKIRNTHGKGDVSGSFRLGFGDISGHMEIDTDDVNHCNKCGNEWKKFKTKFVSTSDIVRVALKYLGDMLDNPKEKEYSWKVETVRVFENCYAETIFLLRKEHDAYLFSNQREQLTNSNLRQRYKSVFDIIHK
jgi:hypothetical protein